ncbi:MAG: MlaA family lipoprotein [Planktomarina sp.]
MIDVRSWGRCLIGVVALLTITACATPQTADGVYDPFEGANRKTHAFNKGLDRNLVGPVARGYDTVVPDPVEDSVTNFADNLGLPGKVVNNVLQADLLGAGKNTLRFLINTTAGIGGIFDPSTVMGLHEADTDFGQTLDVWGVREGAYVELPIFGPSTSRDAVGIAVDMMLDPMSYVIGKPQSDYRSAARVGERLQQRHDLGSQIDGVLYESADSYAQLRLLYLQNRRFELGGDTGETYIDPYLDPYEGLE